MLPRMRLALVLCSLLLVACESADPPAPPARMKAAVGTSPVLGPADAWVTVVVFSDLECPYCADEHPLLLELRRLYPADLRLVWKHFPLSRHAHARGAAIATECAKQQGLFWEMVEIVFRNRTDLLSPSLAAYATLAGLDGGLYAACLAGTEAAAAVDADLALGRSLGVPGTPTMAVNGKTLFGAYDLPVLQAAVEAARTAAVASGVDRAVYYEQVVLGP